MTVVNLHLAYFDQQAQIHQCQCNVWLIALRLKPPNLLALLKTQPHHVGALASNVSIANCSVSVLVIPIVATLNALLYLAVS